MSDPPESEVQSTSDPDSDTIALSSLRVLLAHNAYQHRGGEDSVFEAERDMLLQRGHPVEVYERHNDEVRQASKLGLLRDTFWSPRTVREISERIARFKPDVIHVHNTFPLISPSLYAAARAHRVPVVQTLHNFRLLCPQAIFLRRGRVCEDCVGRSPWRAVVHRCYRDSASQSAVLGGMLQFHRTRGTFERDVTLYIALNEFCREKFVEGGLPKDRIRIKPNFIAEPAPAAPVEREGFLFVGRLSPEKGIDILLAAAAARAPGTGRPAELRIVGTGPLQECVAAQTHWRALGGMPADGVLDQMRRTIALVIPSVCHESFPRTIVEAFACGLPVIASRLGALPSLVDDGRTGLLFEPGNASDLATKLDWAAAHPREMAAMGVAARTHFEHNWTDSKNYALLAAIYREAIALALPPQTSP